MARPQRSRDDRPWTFYALGDAVRRLSAVSLRPDGGDRILSFQGPNGGVTFPMVGVLGRLVPGHSQARPDGQYPGLVRRARSRWPRSSASLTVVMSVAAGLAFRRRFPGSGAGVLSRRREPRDAEPPGRLRHRPRLPVSRHRAEPFHLGARRPADLDAAVRPFRDVRRGQPLQPLLGGGGQRSRRQRPGSGCAT